MFELVDPPTIAALEAARRAHGRASGAWVSDEEEEDPAAEAEQLAREALAHLEGGRWDEARSCAEAAAELGEDHGHPALWREFALLVEEAAETGLRAQPASE